MGRGGGGGGGDGGWLNRRRRGRGRRRRRMVEEPLHWSRQWDQDYFFPSLSILDGWKFSRISAMWRWVGTGNNIRYMEVVGGHW